MEHLQSEEPFSSDPYFKYSLAVSFLLVWGWNQMYNACYSSQTAYKLVFKPVVQIIRQQGAKSLLS